MYAIQSSLILVAVSFLVAGDQKLPCTVDSDCKLEECCAINLKNQTTMCREQGDDLGDACGGDFRCSRCRGGLQCVEFSNNITDAFVTDDCMLPMNGSCQYSIAKPVVDASEKKRNKPAAIALVRTCTSDMDCRPKECCTQSFEKQEKICREIGDDYGDSCGGDYFCNSCRKGLVCVLDYHYQSHSTDNITDELVCSPPANGTCKYFVPELPAEDATLQQLVAVKPLCPTGFNMPCQDDIDCCPKQCCATHYNGKHKICQDKGKRVNDPCGGDYFCNACRNELVCIPVQSTKLTDISTELAVESTELAAASTELAVETTELATASTELAIQESNSIRCPLPANGTCQYPVVVDVQPQ